MEPPHSTSAGVLIPIDAFSRDLDRYFTSATAVPPTQNVFADISRILRFSEHPREWAENPKLYYILRRIRREDLIEQILDTNFTDLWLPFPKRMLQKVLGEKDLKTFLDVQDLCLDEEIALNLRGQHFSLEDLSIMDFQELKVLGVGGYGEVHHMKDLRTGIEYARKVMVRPSNVKRHHDLMHQFKRELYGMRRVRHRHCVTLRASCTDLVDVAIFSTPVADMDLAAFLDLDLDIFQISILRKAVGCITAALSYLHEQGIRHDDLKPNNILLYRSEIILTDFGFCLDSSDSGISTTTGAPTHFVRRYSAPEVFEHDPRNRLTDIWGLGCVLFEVLSRIRGFKLQQMRTFWLRNGNRNDSFAENPDATVAWFTSLTENATTTQHGPNRSELLMISYVYRVLLEKDRLLRPTARQVLDKLADLDMVYPDSTSFWVGECCSQQVKVTSLDHNKSTAGVIHFEGHLPQWPLLDLTTLDHHLAFLFMDQDLRIVAKSQNLAFLDGRPGFDSDFPGLGQVLPRDDIHRIQTATASMLQTLNVEKVSTNASHLIFDHIMQSVSINSIQDTVFWVGILNIYWKEETTPRLRTVQLSLSRICLERQSDQYKPFFVMTFDPNEGEVVEASYQEGRDVWTDGLSILFMNDLMKSLQYRNFQIRMKLRKDEYLRLLNERRTIIRGLKKTKCFWCMRLGIECSGPTREGSCEQCLAQGPHFHNPCKFDVDVIQRGGETQMYIDRKEFIVERMITERWGS